MPEFTFDFVIQIEYYEPNIMAPVDEGYGHIRYYDDRIDDLMILGATHFSKSLLPERKRGDVTDYEVTMSWFDSSQDVSEIIGETRSVVELRADFMGIRRKSSDSAWFVFREPESTDYETRKGMMDIYPKEGLPEGESMVFLDWSTEFKGNLEVEDLRNGIDRINDWPMAEPYESYYVTFEFKHSPGALNNPPRKRHE